LTKEFLLQKDKKENKEMNAQMAHLSSPDAKANPSQRQRSHFMPSLQEKLKY
jgi:hypothetical protein